MALKDKLKNTTVNKYPLWKGPEVDGITQSMLSGFINCPERFRVMYLEGIETTEGLNHRIFNGVRKMI